MKTPLISGIHHVTALEAELQAAACYLSQQMT